MPGDSIRVPLRVIDVFEKLNIPYAVGGSLASSLHGVMRSTLDVDIIANMQSLHIEPFVAALAPDFYADDEMIRDAIAVHGSFNLIHYETSFKVDVFIPKSRAFDQMQLDRRQAAVITTNPDREVFVTSPEDVILSKLEWYRMGGGVSDRQWRDILGVLKTRSRDVDLDYLHRWAKELMVEDLLERALEEE